jgi:hypothetical protein
VPFPVQIESAWLAEVQYRERGEWGGDDIWYQIEDEFELEHLELDEAENAYWARGAVTITFSWFADPEMTIEASTAPYDLRVTVTGRFRFAPGQEERFVRAWLDYNGSYLLWPYARANIATITGLGRFSALTIPTGEIPVLPDIESEEDVRPEELQNPSPSV